MRKLILLVGGCFICLATLVWGLVVYPAIERAEQQEMERIVAEIQRKEARAELDRYFAEQEAERASRAKAKAEAENREREAAATLAEMNKKGQQLFETHTLLSKCLHEIAKRGEQKPADVASRYTDCWGHAIRYRDVAGGWLNAGYSLVESAGPDEVFDTADDISDQYDETLYHE